MDFPSQDIEATQKKISQKEFIALMAALMSFAALAIDSMLPALNLIGESLGVVNPNDNQMVISFIFIGMGIGQLLFGPISDAIGRKPSMYIGIGTFFFGCIISYSATTFNLMLLGRLIQGLGAASAKIISTAMVRDRFSGNVMAKTMSLIMIIFVLVPALAPTLGQLILSFGGWRDIFLFMIFLAIINFAWFSTRQEETLIEEYRRPLSFSKIKEATLETVKHPATVCYTLAAGLIFGAFIGYLNSSQQILQLKYGLGDKFPIAFGVLALAIGLSSFLNSKLVEEMGMRKLCETALTVLTIVAIIFNIIVYFTNGNPSFYLFYGFLLLCLFNFGLLFGNFSALALEPMGHIAGTANSVISSVQILISALIGSTIGQLYNETVTPIAIGFLVCSMLSLFIVKKVK
ncbi:multidrug effflux MFS transporter [Halobacteriovorax sp.]|uniref:multidrug effflux MFS transporter n=1 Tax=Halobacteriovorax sp. TaxID=2020862 RepID=UPI003AF2D384